MVRINSNRSPISARTVTTITKSISSIDITWRIWIKNGFFIHVLETCANVVHIGEAADRGYAFCQPLLKIRVSHLFSLVATARSVNHHAKAIAPIVVYCVTFTGSSTIAPKSIAITVSNGRMRALTAFTHL